MTSPESLILGRLLEAKDRFVTGNELAQLLGVSRVTVWKHMKKLRRDGFSFEAVRKRGYRIRETPGCVSLPYLHCLLPEVSKDRLIFLERTGSTNSDAERLLGEGRTAPFVVLTRLQTQGRGRLGRSWHSGDPGNLYASFAFRPQVPPERMQLFTLWMGVSLCRCIEQETGVTPGVKWPNDIWYGDRKMGGILTEAKVNADRILELVLGLGLNINSDPSSWPDPLSRGATSLRLAGNGTLDINALSAAVIGRLLEAYQAFLEDAYRPTLAELWETYDILRNREVAGQRGNEVLSGRARGIDGSGHLLVECGNGGVVRLNAGDVTLRGAGSPDEPRAASP